MKLKFKKLAIMALTVATVASNGMTAFAASNSKTTSGYGKLYGSLTKTGNYVTSVTKNPDKAKLTISGTIQDVNGKTLVTQQPIYSGRGATKLSGHWTNIPSRAYAIYGAHGVQGGTKYGAAVVYTVTHVK